MGKQLIRFVLVAAVFLTLFAVAGDVLATTEPSPMEGMEGVVEGESKIPWWGWPIILFFFTFILGILAVLGGVGGGVLYVPLVSGFFPFHLDFVRGAGLLVALAGALAAGPGLLRRNLASLRLALPVALIASACAIAGAMVGLALPANLVQILLGAVIIGIVILLATAKKSDFPEPEEAKYPISCITTWDCFNQEYITWWLEDYVKESSMLEDFIKYMKKESPDLLLAWNINFD